MTAASLNDLKARALEIGFTGAAEMDPSKIVLRKEVRDTCAADKCKAFNKNWACPPACGSLPDCEAKIKSYTGGIILTSTGVLEDEFDYDGMKTLGETHAKRIETFLSYLKKEKNDCILLGAGSCTRCENCTYPNAPCRFPDKMTSSMEAYGMVVSDVCAIAGIPYYYGRGTLTYVGCALF